MVRTGRPKTKGDTKTIMVRVPVAVKDALVRHCREYGTTQGWVVAQAILEYTNKGDE